MEFLFHRLRFHFRAEGRISFAAGGAGNVLRGAFGLALRQIACVPGCPGAKGCPDASGCAYARIFEPAAHHGAPSGLADPPRPFVFRAKHLDEMAVAAGSRFYFDAHIFSVADESTIAHFTQAFDALGRGGLGPERSRVALEEVEQLDAGGSSLGVLNGSRPSAPPLALSLDPAAGSPCRIEVRFLTPTELKGGDSLSPAPEFAVLLSRVRDRLSTLSALYGRGPLEIDFAGFGRRASAVRTTRCEVRHVPASRLSSRTGRRHPLGGFTGFAEYQGEQGVLDEFLPFLKAAQFTGVGRQTTWGKGEIQVGAPGSGCEGR